MNKRGFTVIELTVVSIIIIIIVLLAVPAYGMINQRISQTNYENLVSLIELKAAAYAEETNLEAFFVEDLIDAGLLETDDDGNVISPIDKKDILNCQLITIDKEKGNISAKLSNEKYIESNNTCDSNKINELNTKAKIEVSTVNDKAITAETNYWTNEDVKLKASLNSSITGGEITGYTWYEGSKKIDHIKYGDPTGDTLTISANGMLQQKYRVVISYKVGEVINNYSSEVLVKIDKIIPRFYNDDQTNKDTDLGDSGYKKLKNYYANAYDNESGIFGYALARITDENQVDCNTATYTTNKGLKINKKGNYKFCIKDKAGNINYKTVEIKNIDNKAPKCVYKFYTGSQEVPQENFASWTKEDRKITIGCDDDEADADNAKSGCTSASTKTFNIITSGSKTYSYTIEDNAGNTTNCSISIDAHVDKNAPSCTVTSSHSGWTKDKVTITSTCSDSESGCPDAYKTIVDYVDREYDGSAPDPQRTITDNVGNTAKCVQKKVRIDRTKPVIRFSLNGTSVTATCTDSGSGVSGQDSYTWDLNSATSPFTASFTCSDKVGNSITSSKIYTKYEDGCDEYERCGAAPCEVPASCPNAGCGCASYNTCQNAACGTETYKYTGPGITIYSCAAGGVPRGCTGQANCICEYTGHRTKTCATPACGCAAYNTCPNEGSCGCAMYRNDSPNCPCARPRYSWKEQ